MTKNGLIILIGFLGAILMYDGIKRTNSEGFYKESRRFKYLRWLIPFAIPLENVLSIEFYIFPIIIFIIIIAVLIYSYFSKKQVTIYNVSHEMLLDSLMETFEDNNIKYKKIDEKYIKIENSKANVEIEPKISHDTFDVIFRRFERADEEQILKILDEKILEKRKEPAKNKGFIETILGAVLIITEVITLYS